MCPIVALPAKCRPGRRSTRPLRAHQVPISHKEALLVGRTQAAAHTMFTCVAEALISHHTVPYLIARRHKLSLKLLLGHWLARIPPTPFPRQKRRRKSRYRRVGRSPACPLPLKVEAPGSNTELRIFPVFYIGLSVPLHLQITTHRTQYICI